VTATAAVPGSTAPRSWDAELQTATEVALAAGTSLLRAWRRPRAPGSDRATLHDLTTEVDVRVERAIRARLRAAFPRDAIVGEELPTTAASPGTSSGRTWLVDPLDGTIGYASGLPLFCVSIALVEATTAVLGVIRDPVHGETFVGIRGAGAWLTTGRGRIQPLRVRTAPAEWAVVAATIGVPDDSAEVARLERLARRVRATRSFGSTALALSWLAAGRLDGVLQPSGLHTVDVAAGAVIAAEAGALVTDAAGGPWLHDRTWSLGRGIAAAPPHLHKTLLEAGRDE